MNKLRSIQEIEDVFDTNDKPALVQCNDLEYYVVKHNKGRKPCHSLFAEYLAYHLLKAIDIQLPELALLEIQPNHIVPSPICQPIFYKNIECFGTMYLETSLEWSKFEFNKKDLKKIRNSEDLFKIAWCDIWLANEDRNWNNSNLLLNPVEEKWDIVPIDYGASFNSLAFGTGRNLQTINDADTIINSPQYKTIARKHFKTLNDADQFARNTYICIKNCETKFDEIVANTPKSWSIPSEYINQLKKNLFSPDWLKETKTQFLIFTKQSLNLK